MDDDRYKEVDREAQNLPKEVLLLIEYDDKDSDPKDLGNKIHNKMVELVTHLKSISPHTDEKEFVEITKDLTILCKYFDFSSVSIEFPSFLENVLNLTNMNYRGEYYNHVFILLATIAIKSPSCVKGLIENGFFKLLNAVANGVFTPEMKGKAYDVCSALCADSKQIRDQLLFIITMKSLYYSCLGESNSIILQSIMKLTQIYSLFPLDPEEVKFAFSIFKICFLNDGTKEISLNARRYAIRGIYLLISGKYISYKEFFDYPCLISNFFGSDPIVTEYLCYIFGDYVDSKHPLPIPIEKVVDQLLDRTSPPKLISAIARCVGLLVLNASSLFEGHDDNIELFIQICSIFNEASYSVKEELGFAIIAFTTILPRDVLLSLMMGSCSTTFETIFTLKNEQTLEQAVYILEEMMELAYAKKQENKFNKFLQESEIISILEDIDDNNDNQKLNSGISRFFETKGNLENPL